MNGRKAHFAASLLGGLLLSLPALQAASPNLQSFRFAGSIAGYVRDQAGVPQMGATVLLMNRYERVVGEAVTNDHGAFGFGSLAPDLYSVRVSLASFMPAMKRLIDVRPGIQSLLYISLASLVSSVELVYAPPGQGGLMSEDWKWTLKSSAATRPVLRLVDPDIFNPDRERSRETPVFSDTMGIFRVSAGDSDGAGAGGIQPDMGTAFAVATSLYGRNRLQLSANLGYASRNGAPAAGFRTTFRRDGFSPVLSVTVRQVYLPMRFGGAFLPSSGDGLPALRTMSMAFNDRIDFGDRLRLDYGSSLDSISFIQRLSTMSPYARLTYEMGSLGAVRFGFSAGTAPTGLFDRADEAEAQLHQDLAALALMPVISLRNGTPEMQRTENFELGYEKRMGSRTFRATAYRQAVSNAALTAQAPAGLLPGSEILPDIASNSGIFDIGNYQSTGYSTSFTQAIGDKTEVGVAYGGGGALAMDNGSALNSAQAALDLRSRFHVRQTHWASARFSTTLPKTGTQITGSYEWTDPGTLMQMHYSMTDPSMPEPGCNLRIRQPIPTAFGLPGRLEATAEVQNLLAQGYISVPAAGAQRVVLTEMPRVFRGGLAIVF